MGNAGGGCGSWRSSWWRGGRERWSVELRWLKALHFTHEIEKYF
jgi:hypothetical protein